MGDDAPIYLGYSQDALDAQYDQATLVPDLAPYLEYWTRAGEAARRDFDCRTDIAYGRSPSERLDIFPAANQGAPVVIYFHGGAWRRLSKQHGAFPAPAFVAAGACYAAVDFAPADAVALDEMVRQVRSAVAWLHANARDHGGDPERLYLLGHSSGAHLAAMVLADGWRADCGLPEDAIKGAVIVSGAYDLGPVRLSARNAYLRLDDAAAARNSANRHVPPASHMASQMAGPPILVGWGGNELAEFRRQGAAFAEAWRAAGNPCETLELVGHNHFDMANAFGDADGPVVEAALRLMGLAPLGPAPLSSAPLSPAPLSLGPLRAGPGSGAPVRRRRGP